MHVCACVYAAERVCACGSLEGGTGGPAPWFYKRRGIPLVPDSRGTAQGIPAPPRALPPSPSVRAFWSTGAVGPLAGHALSDPKAVTSHCCSRPPSPPLQRLRQTRRPKVPAYRARRAPAAPPRDSTAEFPTSPAPALDAEERASSAPAPPPPAPRAARGTHR